MSLGAYYQPLNPSHCSRDVVKQTKKHTQDLTYQSLVQIPPVAPIIYVIKFKVIDFQGPTQSAPNQFRPSH